METRLLLFFLLFNLLLLLLFKEASTQMPGFVSLDCGGEGNFTDELGLHWSSDDDDVIFGKAATISVANETRKQYTTLRHFPADFRKYCYTLSVVSRTRYLLRATFLYGNFDNNNVYPKFDVSVGATPWSTIVISDANTIESIELIFLASSPTVSVCLSNATTGQPFISTIELRQFNGSIYYTIFESQFYLSVSARINFGAESEASIRYPNDPFDRIWQSDLVKKANYLVDVAAGTERVSTDVPIDISSNERPPEKVMQTAVVGTNGTLTYRLNLDGFPGFGWAFTYFAEIEDLSPNESRKFRLVLPDHPELSKAVVNIQENAHGKHRVYEPGFPNISLPFVLSFKFGKTSDSSMGPLLNALEISKYLEKNDGSPDGGIIAGVISLYLPADWAQEGGDPCLPVPWSWVQCSSDTPPKIVKISLSGKNLTGNIPSDLTRLTGLTELWLDGNSLTGTIPDFTGCPDLRIIHLENNELMGELPSSLMKLPNLRELYVQNNRLSGKVPSGLLGKSIVLNYSGNINLREDSGRGKQIGTIIGSSVGAALLLTATVLSCLFMRKQKKRHPDQEQLQDSPRVQRLISIPSVNAPTEAAYCFTYAEIEDATKKFEKKVGSGGFGVVYYGKMKDGKEIAVKILTSNSYQGKREFSNEVTLLSRIHHRNLVQFLGYCQEDGKSLLVYEFMHNGTLKEHLYGPLTHGRNINWLKRLEIAEDAAKGLELQIF
uniref:non-specific serine/threonine protein kinase n=1 Tax=Rhizophora mucronata TaxID=61149 RepID=A0A2P2KUU7_RHIMU